MKKAAAVLLAALFTLALCACGDSGTGVSSAASAEVSSAESAAVSSGLMSIDGVSSGYAELLTRLYRERGEVYFFVKDMDGDGTAELMVQNNTAVEVYSPSDEPRLLDSYDFVTGTTQLFNTGDPRCFGLIYCCTGGGADHYGRISLEGGRLLLEDLWLDRYAFASEGSPDRIERLSDDGQLIEISMAAAEKGLYVDEYRLTEEGVSKLPPPDARG